VFSPVNRSDGSRKDTVRNLEETGEFVGGEIYARTTDLFPLPRPRR
jgi:hypothetical protein